MDTCNSCNTGKSAVPDMYTVTRRPEGECKHIRQCTSTCVATNMLHFQYSKNLPNLLLITLPIYIAKNSHYDYGILFHLFIQYILLVSFH